MAKDLMGDALRRIRYYNDTSLADLAVALSRTPSHLSAIEHGRHPASRKLVRAYAKHFNIHEVAVYAFAQQLERLDILPSTQGKAIECIKVFLDIIEKFGHKE